MGNNKHWELINKRASRRKNLQLFFGKLIELFMIVGLCYETVLNTVKLFDATIYGEGEKRQFKGQFATLG
ncbi:MAG: hypothetical protein JWP37_1683 [Mucilaginibacter sp.]|nr:hypothetical protein [Mucilaginibacter sp.]